MLAVTKRTYRLKSGVTSTVYQITGTDPWTHEPVRVGTRAHDPKTAQIQLDLELERRRKAALNGGKAPPTRPIFAAVIAEYGAKGGEDRYLTPIVKHFGAMIAEDITDTELSEFARVYYPGARPSTLVRQVYGPMQWIWNAGVRARMIPPRIFARPEVKVDPVRYARSDDWTMAVLRACTNIEQRCALLLLSFGGVRAAEAVSARRCDWNPLEATLTIQTKGRRERVVPLSTMLNDAFQLLPARAPQEPLLGYASRYSLNRILKRACARAGVEYLSPHKAGRHSFAARLLRDGASLKELQMAGGWEDINLVARTYAHLERSMVDTRVRQVATPIVADSVTMPYTLRDGSTAPLQITQEKQGDQT